MVSAEVQRTLVKSPPELWAELSHPTSLARHLEELGDIRITGTHPETTVAWEGEKLAGTVSIQASGWGTKVTLAVQALAPPGSEPAPASEATAEAQPEPASEVAAKAEPGPAPEPEPAAAEPKAVAVTAAQPAIAQPAPAEPRRGFLARLFRRRRTAAESTQPDAFAAVAQALAPESFVVTDVFAQPAAGPPSPLAEPTAEAGDISAELQAAEEVPVETVEAVTAAGAMSAEEIAAVLSGVLDRLGAAHHRPFSRA